MAGGLATASVSPSKRPPKLAPGPTPGLAMMPGVGGTVFDEDDDFSAEGGGGGSSALELDEIRVVPSGSLASAASLATLGPASLAPPVERFRRGGFGGAIEPTADEREASALADYGDRPERWWQAPLYAYRVKTRQSELRRQLAERRHDLVRAREACEEAKLAFAERARPVAQKVELFANLLSSIAVAERVMLERDTALSAQMEAHDAQLRVIEGRVVQLEAELVDAKSEESRAEEELAAAEAIRQRAEAKMKRVEIEIRNIAVRADVDGGSKRVVAKGAGTQS